MATPIAALIAALHEATPEELSAILCELDRGMPLWQARQAAAAAEGTDTPPLLQVGTPHAADPVKPKRRPGRPKKAASATESEATGAAASSDSESAASGSSRGRPRLTPEERAAREEAKLAARAAAAALREEAKAAAKAEKAAAAAAAKEAAAAEKAAAKAEKAAAAAAKKAGKKAFLLPMNS
jgi:hypothetical protein